MSILSNKEANRNKYMKGKKIITFRNNKKIKKWNKLYKPQNNPKKNQRNKNAEQLNMV